MLLNPTLEIFQGVPDLFRTPFASRDSQLSAKYQMFAKAAGDAKAKNLCLVAVEPTSCPTLTKGHYAYDFGDAVGLTPLMLMYPLGHDFMPPGIHAGGLRYHGDSPLVSQLYHEKLIEAVAVPQVATFEAGVQFARTEGIVPAPGALDELEDAEIIERLTTIRGVGQWTVEMLLIFKLGRLDVLPADDFGVRKGFMLTYRKRELPKPAVLLKHGERWRPYRSIASWYLWRAADLAKAQAR